MTSLKWFSNAAATLCAAGTGLVLSVGAALAIDEAATIKLGEAEFMSNCAACHGATGHGDGPVAEVLTAKPKDLTMIAARFGGTFPMDQVYKVIDGQDMINPHGDRHMPVWGSRYWSAAVDTATSTPHDVDSQALVHGRIMALVAYLQSIQAK